MEIARESEEIRVRLDLDPVWFLAAHRIRPLPWAHHIEQVRPTGHTENLRLAGTP